MTIYREKKVKNKKKLHMMKRQSHIINFRKNIVSKTKIRQLKIKILNKNKLNENKIYV